MKIKSIFTFCAVFINISSALAVVEKNGDVDGGVVVNEVCDDGYILHGKIDGNSTVTINCRAGDIRIDGKIDGASKVKLIASSGSIYVGEKIDGASLVCLMASGVVKINEKIDNSETRVFWQGGSASVSGGVNGGAKFVFLHCPW